MHCRVVNVRIKPDKLREAIDLYEKSVIPAAKLQKGYRGSYLLTDRATGKCLSISLWNSQEDMAESERNGYYREQLAKYSTLFAEEPITDHYDLVTAVYAEG